MSKSAPLSKQQEDRFREMFSSLPKLYQPNGDEVPGHQTVLRVGETVAIKHYTFKVVLVNDCTVVLEPLGPYVIGESEP